VHASRLLEFPDDLHGSLKSMDAALIFALFGGVALTLAVLAVRGMRR